MAASFKNGVSLHQLLETAPLGALQDFLLAIDEASYAEAFGDVPWSDAADDANIHAIRRQLLDIANALDPPAAAPLDRHAHRILTLAEGRGSETIRKVGARIFSHADVESFAAQLDDLGRSLWLYHHQSALFDEAESLFYADHYRNFGRLYDAFEVAADPDLDLVWDESVADALASDIQQTLDLSGRCAVAHVEIPAEPSKKAESGGPQHLVIVRHGGPLSSVAEFLETEGSRQERYYRPLNEATVLFTPDPGVIEVFSASPAVRQAVAASFAAAALKIDLSTRPLTLKQYNLSRFLTSLQLPQPVVDGFDIERVAVVEAEARPDNFKHRLSLKVTIDDDIEDVAEELLGQVHLFHHAACISRVVIAVRYTQHGATKTKTLNITLSDPNRCNLRSNRDPVQRELGEALLREWGILRQVQPLTADGERALFPDLLQLFDQTVKEVPGQFFILRGLDPEALMNGGFIERRGRASTLLLDEDGLTQAVSVQSAGQPGRVCYEHPVDGSRVELPVAAVANYRIRHDWLNEIILKHLKALLAKPRLTKLDDCLIDIGEISLADERVPCYLARDLRKPKTLQRLDILLRAKSDKGVGLILTAGRDQPPCLGPNVIASLPDFLGSENEDAMLDHDQLASHFVQSKQLARGGMVVDIIKKDNYSATLYIPGKPTLALVGPKVIAFFQALVDAYKKGTPAVPTKQLMAAADSNCTSPRQLLGATLWASVSGVYVDFPPGVKKGSYQLLV